MTQEEQNLADAKMRAEISELIAQTFKLNAETIRLNAETAKISNTEFARAEISQLIAQTSRVNAENRKDVKGLKRRNCAVDRPDFQIKC